MQRPIIKIPDQIPECPLCDKRMREIYHGPHRFFVCLETECMISINANDPCINRWSLIEKPKCQLCGNPMRVFVRKDKVVIMQCRDKSHRMYQVARGDARAFSK